MNAIDEIENIKIIFTKPNSDPDNQIIIDCIDKYVESNQQKAVSFKSMGSLKYLSTLKFVDAVVGNSSSGIIEAPSFKIGTINVGDRQKGRLQSNSIIDCSANKNSIKNAFKKLYSDKFQKMLETVKNPYEKKNTCKNIVKILKTCELDGLLKKEFYNLKNNS